MVWFYIFLISIFFDSFSNTFKYFWNLLGTIFSTILISIFFVFFLFFYYFCYFHFFFNYWFLKLFLLLSLFPSAFAILASFVSFSISFHTHLDILSSLPSQFSNQSLDCSMLAMTFLILHPTSALLSYLLTSSSYVSWKTILLLLYTLLVLYN